MAHLLTKLLIQIFLLALKLDGNPISWVFVLSPIWGSILDIMFLQIAGYVVNAIKTKKRETKFQTTFGNRLVWDANTQTMYGGHKSEEVK